MKTFAFVGGVIGLVLFLAIGLLPSLVYGGFAGVAIASAILGGPVIAGSILAKSLIISGITVVLLAVASIFVVLGSAIGAGIGVFANAAKNTLVEETIN